MHNLLKVEWGKLIIKSQSKCYGSSEEGQLQSHWEKAFAHHTDPLFQQTLRLTLCCILYSNFPSSLVFLLVLNICPVLTSFVKLLVSSQFSCCCTPNIQVALKLFVGVPLRSFSLSVGFLPWNLLHVILSSHAGEIVNSLWGGIIHITCFATSLGLNRRSCRRRTHSVRINTWMSLLLKVPKNYLVYFSLAPGYTVREPETRWREKNS